MKHAPKEHSSPGGTSVHASVIRRSYVLAYAGYPVGFVKALKQDITVAIVCCPMQTDLDSSRHHLRSRPRFHCGAGRDDGRPPLALHPT